MAYRRCSKCGGKIRLDSEYEACAECRKKDEHSFPTTLRGQGRPVRGGGRAVCKMPYCHKQFDLTHDQDPRFTWYCPECRREIAEITTGVLWLESWGIMLPPTKNILEDSLSLALDG